ncbi:hypothetical protein FEM48_Zijuj06G0210600 [Ziziphus jujuba var. spinosa]|uniref:Uncharacterized protein n=1 Tax=Ziziphus jujuba var. spinosa TaxID=714518 RepID=A0A978VBL8_ZIZJJ|nr:hypothetical protein FEM48_Zijuj06G0210600 [Ziziphus jujuba var. spinosa]
MLSWSQLPLRHDQEAPFLEDNYWIFFLESSIVVAEGEMHVEGIFQRIDSTIVAFDRNELKIVFILPRGANIFLGIELSRSRIAEGIQVEGNTCFNPGSFSSDITFVA